MPHRIGRTAGIVLLALASLATPRLLAQSGTADPQWTSTWPGLGETTSLLLDPTNPLRLFVGTELGLVTSIDGGQSWSLQWGTPRVIRALALDPSNSSRVFAGSNSGVYTSADAGAHFTQDIPNATVAIAIDLAAPRSIYT